MMTEPIQKKKKKTVDSVMKELTNPSNMLMPHEQIIIEIDEKYVGLVDVADRKKKDVIREYADALRHKGEMPIDKICKHLCDKLEGLAARDYIIRCLPDEFKNQDQMNRRRAGRPRSTETKCPHCGLYPSDKPKREDTEIWNIKPSAYRLEDLKHYDKLCMDSIIRYLHEELKKKQ